MVSDFDEEEGLIEVSDLLVVDLGKVLSHRYLLAIVIEFLRHWVLFEVDISDDVSPLGSPVSDHRLAREFGSDCLL